jgi:hypothetical protein
MNDQLPSVATSANGHAEAVPERRRRATGRKAVPAEATSPDETPADDGAQLREAMNTPGVVEITETPIEPKAGPVLEIPEASLDAGEGGDPLDQDPALMSVAIDRPGPHSWVQIFPDKVLRTVLLAYKPDSNGSPEFHYIVPELQKGLQKELKQVRIHLLFDTNGPGVPFLWIVPETNFSPYYNALMLILSKGEAYLRDHLFRFAKAELKAKTCDVRVRGRGPDDPQPILPSRPISKLLPEALKQERIITSASHPVYVSLMSGGRLK